MPLPELKSCPFCGETTSLQTMSAADYWDDGACVGTTVVCRHDNGGCGSHCGFIKTTRAAKERWNHRAADAATIESITFVANTINEAAPGDLTRATLGGLSQRLFNAIAAWNRRAPTGGQEAGWQTMESAPKDGQILLGAYFDGPHDFRVKTGGWNSEVNDWYVIGASWEPSHWMPLPEPPKESGK